MSEFKHVMVLVSIIIGLAITHVAAAIHRLRGHGDPVRLESVYLLRSGYVLIWLASFWWREVRVSGHRKGVVVRSGNGEA